MFIFNSFDDFSEAVQEWELDFKQISSGSLQASLSMCLLDNILIYQCSFNKTIDQVGVAPFGMRTFCMLKHTSAPTNWCNHQIEDHFVLEFVPNKEFSAVSQPGFDVIALSISDHKLQSMARKIGYKDAPLATEFTAHHTSQVEQKQLCYLTEKLMKTDNNWARESIEETLIFQILRICSRDTKLCLKMSHRQRGLEQASHFIRNNLNESITMEDILKSSNVSLRTLEYAFQSRFSLSPKKYVKYLRLNQVHKLLLTEPADHSITDLANNCGFSHMSQFAKDYKALYGQLPSQVKRS